MNLAELSAAVLAGRPALFEADFARASDQLTEAFAGRCVLVIGAGGSIGRASAELLLEQRPRKTLLVDISENNLASITRQLRNRFGARAPEFEAWALDFTGPPFGALLEQERPDVILNFAAFKHVRSEKDHLTLAEMLRVNVLGNLQLVRWAQEHRPARLFAISTDKAASPVSCMGASKRLMEMLLWSAVGETGWESCVTSTRFANVLFSDGSLPASFLERISLRQPLAGPSDVRRYFMTFAEAARLCLLAASHSSSAEFLVPRMCPADQLSFDTIADRLLEHLGYRRRDYGDLESASAALNDDIQAGYWPCLFGPSTTSGEKEAEEFCEAGEQPSDQQPYSSIVCLRPQAGPALPELTSALEQMGSQLSSRKWLAEHNKADIVNWLNDQVPAFAHLETGSSLDSRV